MRCPHSQSRRKFSSIRKDVEAFEDIVAKGEALERAAHDTWMRRGPVGKAHNFAI